MAYYFTGIIDSDVLLGRIRFGPQIKRGFEDDPQKAKAVDEIVQRLRAKQRAQQDNRQYKKEWLLVRAVLTPTKQEEDEADLIVSLRRETEKRIPFEQIKQEEKHVNIKAQAGSNSSRRTNRQPPEPESNQD